MMLFEIDNLSIVSVLRPNGTFGYHGGCKQHIRPINWFEPGRGEKLELINSAPCSWSVDTFQNINRIRESEEGQKFHDAVLKNDQLCSAMVEYYLAESIGISIFVKQNIFSSFESLVEKCWFNDNLKISISVGSFVSFRSKKMDIIAPTFDEFYSGAAFNLGDITFSMSKIVLEKNWRLR